MESRNYIESVTGSLTPPMGAGLKKDSLRTQLRELGHLAASLSDAIEALEYFDLPDLRSVEEGIDFYAEVRNFEISLIKQALRHTRGSQIRAASLLRLRHTTLNSKIKNYEIGHWRR